MTVPLPDRAMVLAAGLGKRMRPLTDSIPKPMVCVAGKPLIDHVLDQMHRAGVGQVVVNTSYLAAILEAHLAGRHAPVLQISREIQPLETGGGIAKALPLLGDAPFFSANSDTIVVDGEKPALHRLAACWDNDTMDALLLLQPVAAAHGYQGKGDFFLEADGKLRRRVDEEAAPYVFTGMQLLHPRLFAHAPQGIFSLNLLYDFSRDDAHVLHRCFGLVHDNAWLHVGDPEGLQEAESFLAG